MIRSTLFSVVSLVGLVAAGCGNGNSARPAGGGAGGGGAAGRGGTAGAGSSGSGGAGAGGGGGSGAGGAAVASCEQNLTPLHTSGTIVEFPFDLRFEDQPFVYGEPSSVGGGRQVIPLNFRLFVTDVRLLTGSGQAIPVDMVDAAGKQQPYGVFLFNAEEVAPTLRVRAPAGDYAGLTFALGLGPACNKGGAGGRVFPLSDLSQMTWPFPLGYLFLRYEARLAPGTTETALPLEIHMGADLSDLSRPSALPIQIVGSVHVPATGTARKTIRVAMDQILIGASTAVDLGDFPLPPEGHLVAGERLRRNAPGLHIFAFAP